MDEILEQLKISCKTLNKFNISILSLNKKLNMKKPQSMFEYLVGVYLYEEFDDLEWQATFNDCISPKGFLLKFDYYSKINNLIIEADGIQHKNKNHYFSSEYTLLCDSIKEDYCKNKNIKLIRIPYCKKVDKKYILDCLNN